MARAKLEREAIMAGEREREAIIGLKIIGKSNEQIVRSASTYGTFVWIGE